MQCVKRFSPLFKPREGNTSDRVSKRVHLGLKLLRQREMMDMDGLY